uniref:Uncharacterized protein n=1 Tax=Apteryx owenii TaxID=8824 RepID=A0A8B9S6V8_APTOW
MVAGVTITREDTGTGDGAMVWLRWGRRVDGGEQMGVGGGQGGTRIQPCPAGGGGGGKGGWGGTGGHEDPALPRAHHLLQDIVGEEAVLDVGHLHVHGDAVVIGPLLGEQGAGSSRGTAPRAPRCPPIPGGGGTTHLRRWHHPEGRDSGLGAGVAVIVGPCEAKAGGLTGRHGRRGVAPAPPAGRALTADEGQAGLEAVAAALQLELVVHLGVDVVQRGQRGAEGVAVVPAHQREPPQEQALADLRPEKGGGGDGDAVVLGLPGIPGPAPFAAGLPPPPRRRRIRRPPGACGTGRLAGLSALQGRRGVGGSAPPSPRAGTGTGHPAAVPTLRVGVPPAAQVPHHFAPRQVAVEILKEKAKSTALPPPPNTFPGPPLSKICTPWMSPLVREATQHCRPNAARRARVPVPLRATPPPAIRESPRPGGQRDPRPAGRGRTRSRRTLLEMATLKGWNLLMAAKDVTSTRVWGLLQDTHSPRCCRPPQAPPAPGHPQRGGCRTGAPMGLGSPRALPGRVAGAQGAVADGDPGLVLRPLPGGAVLCETKHAVAAARDARPAWSTRGRPAAPYLPPAAPPGSCIAASCSSPPASWQRPAPAPGPPSPPLPPPPPPRAARPPLPRWPGSAGGAGLAPAPADPPLPTPQGGGSFPGAASLHGEAIWGSEASRRHPAPPPGPPAADSPPRRRARWAGASAARRLCTGPASGPCSGRRPSRSPTSWRGSPGACSGWPRRWAS